MHKIPCIAGKPTSCPSLVSYLKNYHGLEQNWNILKHHILKQRGKKHSDSAPWFRLSTHSDRFRRTPHLNGLEEDVDETHETQQTGDQEGRWEKEGVLRVEGFQKGPPKGWCLRRICSSEGQEFLHLSVRVLFEDVLPLCSKGGWARTELRGHAPDQGNGNEDEVGNGKVDPRSIHRILMNIDSSGIPGVCMCMLDHQRMFHLSFFWMMWANKIRSTFLGCPLTTRCYVTICDNDCIGEINHHRSNGTIVGDHLWPIPQYIYIYIQVSTICDW